MISPYQFWIDLGQLFLSPKSLAFGGADLLLSWAYTRRWAFLLLAAPVIGVFFYAAGSSIYLRWLGNNEILQRYWAVIESESAKTSTLLKAVDSAESEGESEGESSPELTPSLMSKEELTPLTTMLLSKVLQVDAANTRATYLIGTVLASQGRLAHARQLMRRIAPTGEKGFSAAYAWLAADRIQSLGVKDKNEFIALMDDLEQAAQWPNVSTALMSAYSDLLAKEKNFGRAFEVLQAAGKRDSRLKVKLAALAKQSDNENVFNAVRDELLEPRMQRITAGRASELDYMEVTSLRLIAEEFREASELARMGLKDYPQSQQLRRMLSDSYVVAYDQALKNSAPSIVRMEFLDQAMKSDPGNPSVVEKLAALTADGQLEDAGSDFAAHLRAQLAEGKATAVTHLFLAIGHLKKKELEKAIVHLEIAEGLAPRNPIILNNLALCIARVRPEELPRAKLLIETALMVTGSDPELLDTYGEILAQGKDYVKAIRVFEAVLSIDQNRPSTRQKLADAYTQVALDDMAESVKMGGAAANSPLNEQGLIKADDILKMPAEKESKKP